MLSSQKVQPALLDFIEKENLPAAYLQTIEQWFIPLTEDIRHLVSSTQGTLILGIHGCQGSGKSTLAALLVLLFQEKLGIRSINLSLDDFYLTRAEREALAANVHPLLITRGVPGTHDVALALKTLNALKQRREVAIPRFDKSLDDRAPQSQWPHITTPVDVIIIEGWCLGVGPQKDSELQEAMNALEAEEDKGEWRAYVNKKLSVEYQELFKLLDLLIMLKAPDFSNILEWRLQQENKLRQNNNISDDSKLMNIDELKRFILHYERLTRHALSTVPATANVVYQLNDDQSIKSKLKG